MPVRVSSAAVARSVLAREVCNNRSCVCACSQLVDSLCGGSGAFAWNWLQALREGLI